MKYRFTSGAAPRSTTAAGESSRTELLAAYGLCVGTPTGHRCQPPALWMRLDSRVPSAMIDSADAAAHAAQEE